MAKSYPQTLLPYSFDTKLLTLPAGVVRWKDSQINNGILEGLNSVIQAAKRKARGYKIKHFKTMAFLLTGKFNFNLINPYLPTRFA